MLNHLVTSIVISRKSLKSPTKNMVTQIGRFFLLLIFTNIYCFYFKPTSQQL